MRVVDIIRLVILAAIWGGSFVFLRVLSPVLGPILTTELRVLIAGLALWGYLSIVRFDLQWRKYWKQYFTIGVVNSALPFFLFSFAAEHIPASYSVILNSAAPLFGAIFSAIWLSDRLTKDRILGLVVGASGVALVANVRPAEVDSLFLTAILACVLATVCYGFAATFIKRFAKNAPPRAIAASSQLTAAVFIMPAVPFTMREFTFTPAIALNILGLALICSAVAYLLYFRLIANVGPTKALTVTFLMPAFGMLWGNLFLGEAITPAMLLGTVLILLGTSIVLRVFKPGRKVAAESK